MCYNTLRQISLTRSGVFILKNKKRLLLLYMISFILVVCVGRNTISNVNSPEKESSMQSLTIHFIDVGQADAILIKIGNDAMIIDAGNNGDGDKISTYLKQQGVTNLNYVIGTHPHEDHIGGLDIIIRDYKVDKVFLPNYIIPTKTFEDVLLAIKDKNMKITKPVVGTEYALGEAVFTIICPNSLDYGDNANNYSIGIKLKYGKNTFLMAGDAEIKSEAEMIINGVNLKADVLKISHHGSGSSTSKEFLKLVDPTYAVISVGKDNQYGHPDDKVLSLLVEDDVQIYRTDEQGTIIVTSDGENISFQCENSIQ